MDIIIYYIDEQMELKFQMLSNIQVIIKEGDGKFNFYISKDLTRANPFSFYSVVKISIISSVG